MVQQQFWIVAVETFFIYISIISSFVKKYICMHCVVDNVDIYITVMLEDFLGF